MRRFRDRDFIRTTEDFFFCVVGSIHPTGRVISYLKYVPAKTGSWSNKNRRYRRVMQSYTIPSLLRTFRLLEQDHPHYLFFSPTTNITMTATPYNCIREHFKPEEGLSQLLQTSKLDFLQKRLVKFISVLKDSSHVQSCHFGVTGSILLGIHQTKFSDMDITVYGSSNSMTVKEALIDSQSLPSSNIKRLEGSALKSWCIRKARDYPLKPEEALRIYERKWNIGIFEGIPFSIHPVKLEEEIEEEFGDKAFFPSGQATIRGTIQNNSGALFLPSIYLIRDVDVLNGPKVKDVRELTSYESLYTDLAKVEETVTARGKLEKVIEKKTNQEYYRVLVGSANGMGKEYIKFS